MDFSQKASPQAAFTLLELLITIAIIAVLSAVLIILINPAELFKKSRDSQRLSDLSVMKTALGIIYSTNPSLSVASTSVLYASLPDTSSSCANLGLPALQSPWVYGCAPASTSQAVDSSGYIPVNFAGITGGSPIGALPVDPINTSSSGNYYTFTAQSGQYEMTGLFESVDNTQDGVTDKVTPSGGQSALYTVGSNVSLAPLATNKGLVGYWKVR